MEFRFRKATYNDLDTLNKLSLASKAYWKYPESWLEMWKEELILHPEDFDKFEIMVLETNSSCIGFCAVSENPDHYEIEHLWILPKYIGKGYGKLLLTYSLNQIVKNSKVIIVKADPNAEDFYQKQGFETYDKVESYPPGRSLPLMKKTCNKLV